MKLKFNQPITVTHVAQSSSYRGEKYLVRGIGKRTVVVRIITTWRAGLDQDTWNGSDEQIADVATYASRNGWKHVVMYYSYDYECRLIARSDQMQNKWGQDLGEGYWPDPSRGDPSWYEQTTHSFDEGRSDDGHEDLGYLKLMPGADPNESDLSAQFDNSSFSLNDGIETFDNLNSVKVIDVEQLYNR